MTLRKRIARRLCALATRLRAIAYRLDAETKPGPKRGSRRRTPRRLLDMQPEYSYVDQEYAHRIMMETLAESVESTNAAQKEGR